MAETLSPNPATLQKQRPSMAPRLKSPNSPFFLGSNDDNLERAQARAARAAAVRRKAAAAAAARAPTVQDDCLDRDQILDLFHNCIRLASENKINQKNTWELNLIDHLCDIIKVEAEDDTETNFQKASCTLEAGVKIYSMRVDSVHSEAYKVLGGINRVGQENEQDNVAEGSGISDGNVEQSSKKGLERKVSPLSTLEPTFEALNVKKFDVAFAVDPLYHQTSAQFDEGGAKGLLLNNLGVYGGCRVLFDSSEVPGKCMSSTNQHDKGATIDLSFAKENIELMLSNMHKRVEISPTLADIVNLFDENSRRPLDTFSSEQRSAESYCYSDSGNNVESNGDAFENCGTAFDHDDQTSVVGEDSYCGEPNIPSDHEEHESYDSHQTNMDDRFDKMDGYLFLNLGFTSKQNAWAGPDHWKYRKAKGPEDPAKENGSPKTATKPRNKRQAEVDIDFTKSLEMEFPDLFAPPKNPKSILLPANRAPCDTTLPEDCHYQPENLVKLFLIPNVMCLGRKGRNSAEDSYHRDDAGSSPSWGEENDFGGHYDDGDVHSDVDDSIELVSQPRQVNKIEVRYDKTSKQVDVQALKVTLWDHVQQSTLTAIQKEAVSFKQVLATFPKDCRAAASLEDISPHLCFICLLHLANEHGLSIHGCPNMDDLSIVLPPNINVSI